MRIAFSGGGTGGHLYPAIAIAQALNGRAEIDFVGTADRLEASIVPRAGYRLHTVRSRPFIRKPLAQFARTISANGVGIVQSLGIIAQLRPDVLIATGGYVCFPVVVAARVLRTLRLFHGAIALLEPNAQPGLTNRVLAPLVDEVWGAFAFVDPHFVGRYVHTGTPVRAALRNLPSREAALARLGLQTSRKTLLAMGGSQGARSMNDALAAFVGSNGLPEDWQLLQVTGESEYERVRDRLGATHRSAVRPYLDDMSDAYAAADLVFARAGASTLAELAALGLPALLAPYPHAAEDHQLRNAEVLRQAGAAAIISDRELQSGRLADVLADIMQPSRLEALRASAARLQGRDPIGAILARIDALAARKHVR